jgi:hypothetical protein
VVVGPVEPPPPLRQGRDVFIVGAGFSRAISSDMPTLPKLGEIAVQEFRRSPLAALLSAAAVDDLNKGRVPTGDSSPGCRTFGRRLRFWTRASDI